MQNINILMVMFLITHIIMGSALANDGDNEIDQLKQKIQDNNRRIIEKDNELSDVSYQVSEARRKVTLLKLKVLGCEDDEDCSSEELAKLKEELRNAEEELKQLEENKENLKLLVDTLRDLVELQSEKLKRLKKKNKTLNIDNEIGSSYERI